MVRSYLVSGPFHAKLANVSFQRLSSAPGRTVMEALVSLSVGLMPLMNLYWWDWRNEAQRNADGIIGSRNTSGLFGSIADVLEAT